MLKYLCLIFCGDQQRDIMRTTSITYHPDRNVHDGAKQFLYHVRGLGNFISYNRNDSLVLVDLNSAERFQFLDDVFQVAELSMVTETATSEVVIISMGVRYFSNTSNIFLRKP